MLGGLFVCFFGVFLYPERSKEKIIFTYCLVPLERKCFCFWAHLVKAKDTSCKKTEAVLTE